MRTTLKIIIILLAVSVFTMCNTKQNDQKTNNQEVGTFDWLLGEWKRTNDEKGNETFEIWKKINASEYNGVGFTIQNNDTIFQEKMKMLKTVGKWIFLVKTNKDEEFTKFDIDKIEEDEFECKNDTLDFPKLIKYWKNGNKINALVSGDNMELSFEFERLK